MGLFKNTILGKIIQVLSPITWGPGDIGQNIVKNAPIAIAAISGGSVAPLIAAVSKTNTSTSISTIGTPANGASGSTQAVTTPLSANTLFLVFGGIILLFLVFKDD